MLSNKGMTGYSLGERKAEFIDSAGFFVLMSYLKTENHLFKWVDEALIEEIRMVDAKHERVAQGITKFEERVMEEVKSEMVRVEHQMSEKLKEKVDLEIARVAHEMKHKLKIATVAMAVVGAIVGIWTSLSV
ncbi:hypothetical protein DY000_02016873 [Brassica cretica]|uniref:DUF1640 domain-containing protein n=1 Tax=Brassica cretica TaxID=69181 RepID=A0ABQ7CRN4_BRACR|nr:hypothetical protein DY000_02016873 [Brassica cretica]